MSERLYTDLADVWTLVSAPEEYVEEAGLFRDVLREHATGPLRTLLELGCGGGNNAVHLKADFEMTLVDLSEDMLRQSRRLNPELQHHCDDLRSVRLGETFDAVFVHDAVAYMTSREDLRRAMETAFVHCRPGGVALFAPDETRESFEPSHSCGGHDGEGGRGVRYLEWSWDPDPDDETTTTDYAFLVREPDGSVLAVHDRHLNGLFPQQAWLDTLEEVGFEARSVVVEHSEVEGGYRLFVGVRKAE